MDRSHYHLDTSQEKKVVSKLKQTICTYGKHQLYKVYLVR